MFTGAAQYLHILGQMYGYSLLPSWALGTLEIGLVLGFGLCMSICSSAGAPDRES